MSSWNLISDTLPSLSPQLSRNLYIPHVSDIIRLIGIRTGTLKDYSQSSSPAPKNKMELGMIFEEGRKYQYRQLYPNRFFSIGEIVFDGIGLNLDMIDSWNDCPVHEFKCSWFSSNRPMDDPEIMKFQDQVVAYQHVVNELGLSSSTSPHLEIVYPRGNYKSNDVDYRHWVGNFTRDEMKRHWEMIVNHKHLVKIGE